MIWYESIPKERLRLMLHSAAQASARRFHRVSLWVLAGNILGEGSTHAIAACRYAGLDPHSRVNEQFGDPGHE